MYILISGVDLLRTHSPSLHTYTSPYMLNYSKHSRLDNLELEYMHKKIWYVQNFHLPNNCVHSVLYGVYIISGYVKRVDGDQSGDRKTATVPQTTIPRARTYETPHLVYLKWQIISLFTFQEIYQTHPKIKFHNMIQLSSLQKALGARSSH